MTSAPVPHDRSATAAASDAVMTRSEEHLHVTTRRVATSRVRLRKQIVTEMQTITVPVSREEIVIDHLPITDGADVPLPNAGGQELEIILFAERPVITMETIAVERIQISTTTVTQDQTVTEPVGKEQIELHEDPPTDTTDLYDTDRTIDSAPGITDQP